MKPRDGMALPEEGVEGPTEKTALQEEGETAGEMHVGQLPVTIMTITDTETS